MSDQCRARRDGFECTLDAGHIDFHHAHGIGSECYMVWDRAGVERLTWAGNNCTRGGHGSDGHGAEPGTVEPEPDPAGDPIKPVTVTLTLYPRDNLVFIKHQGVRVDVPEDQLDDVILKLMEARAALDSAREEDA